MNYAYAIYESVVRSILAGDIVVIRRWWRTAVAKVAWVEWEPFAVEFPRWGRPRLTPLQWLVKRYPKRIDVYQANPDFLWPEYHRLDALGYCVTRAANGFRDNDAVACAMGDRIGGHVDPCPHLKDGLVLVSDLQKSPFYLYRFTLR